MKGDISDHERLRKTVSHAIDESGCRRSEVQGQMIEHCVTPGSFTEASIQTLIFGFQSDWITSVASGAGDPTIPRWTDSSTYTHLRRSLASVLRQDDESVSWQGQL